VKQAFDVTEPALTVCMISAFYRLLAETDLHVG